jgi:large conductance mechanosensitive channel
MMVRSSRLAQLMDAAGSSAHERSQATGRADRAPTAHDRLIYADTDGEVSNPVIKGFREFIVRGNVIDLAVAIVIGLAFGALVNAFAADVIGGLIGAVFGEPKFSEVGVALNDSRIVFGRTIIALVYFLIVVAVVYYAVVAPANRVRQRRRVAPTVNAPVRECPECLSAIPKAARRCAFCTSVVAPAD